MKDKFNSPDHSDSFRDPYRSTSPPRTQRWDSQRFALEQERERARMEAAELKAYFSSSPSRSQIRQRSVGPVHSRRGRLLNLQEGEGRYEPQPMRERPMQDRKQERYHSPPALARRAPSRPAFLRRQSSLDTFDRKPLTRYNEREPYGLPAQYREPSIPPGVPIPIPLPNIRQSLPLRRHVRESYNEFEVPEQESQDEGSYRSYRRYQERARERDSIKRRGRRKKSAGKSHRGSERSISTDSSTSSLSDVDVRDEFPKRGKTRFPAKLVNKNAIIDLGYPFEEDGNFIVIMKALGRENIDEVIKLSNDYKNAERAKSEIIEERTKLYTIAAPPLPRDSESLSVSFTPLPPPSALAPASPAPAPVAAPVATAPAPVPVATAPALVPVATAPALVPVATAPAPVPVVTSPAVPASNAAESASVSVSNALTVAPPQTRDERAISAEIKALEAQKDVLRAQLRVERLRNMGSGEVVLSEEREKDGHREELTVLRRPERSRSRHKGMRIERDRKGRMSISVPKYHR